MCQDLADQLTPKQTKSATETMKGYLENSNDWIVQNTTIETLAKWAVDDSVLRKWLMPKLRKLSKTGKKSVASRSTKWLSKLDVD